jgi:hypothetical protein
MIPNKDNMKEIRRRLRMSKEKRLKNLPLNIKLGPTTPKSQKGKIKENPGLRPKSLKELGEGGFSLSDLMIIPH